MPLTTTFETSVARMRVMQKPSRSPTLCDMKKAAKEREEKTIPGKIIAL
jgi:hypothetical protein